MCIKGPVNLYRWRKADYGMRRALQQGDIDRAKKEARMILQYLTEMGLLDEPNRQVSTSPIGDISNGVVASEEAKLIGAT